MPFIKAAGKPTLHYELDDFSDEWKDAPVFILQHGYGRSAWFWRRWVPYLSRHYRVVRPDLRGFGRSPLDFDPETGYSVDFFVEDMLRVLDEVSPGRPVHYAGESIGGIVGMATAARHPERLRSLTLLSAPTMIPQHVMDTFAFGHPTWQDALRKMGPEAWAAAANASSRFPPDTDPGLLRQYAKEMGRSHVEALVGLSKAAAKIDVSACLPQIRTPTLGLYPAGGRITGSEENKVRKGIANIRFVSLPTQFHSVQFMMAAECATQALHFAAQIDGVPCRD
jgi:3-oxoadipate enol-lactonase